MNLVKKGSPTFINCKICGKIYLPDVAIKNNKPRTIPFYLYPRSSISKTPLMLANHTGIIDAGYRGNLMVALRALYFDNDNCYSIKSGTRLFQICDPKLRPIYVQIVDESELTTTERSDGGFGSTGV